MTEKLPNVRDTNDSNEDAIDRLMNTTGIGRAEAEARLGQGRSEASDGRQGVYRPTHANRPAAPQRAPRRSLPPVGEDALPVLDTTWSEYSPEETERQIAINATGAAAVRAAIRNSRQADMTPDELRRDELTRKAREDRRKRGRE